MRTQVNFNHHEVFLVLYESLRFVETSRILGIAQSAVSKQIQHLEEFYVHDLFIRSNKKVIPTEFAHELYRNLKPKFQNFLDSIYEIRNQKTKKELKIGCLTSFGENILNPILNEYLKLKTIENPAFLSQIQIEIRLDKGKVLLSDLLNSKLDLAITTDKIVSESICCYPIYTEKVVLIGNVNFEFNKDQSKPLNFVSYRKTDPNLELYFKKFFYNTKASMRNSIQVNSVSSMLEFIKKNDFVGVIPTHCVDSAIQNNELKILSDEYFETKLYLLSQEKKFQSKLEKEISEFIRKNLKSR